MCPSMHADEIHPDVQDFLVEDEQGVVGVVDEVLDDGTILVSCGWFGRRHAVLRFEDVLAIHLAARALILRSGVPEVAELRATGGVVGRCTARLLRRGLTVRSRRAQTTQHSH
jgi:hypothetical protein